MNAGVATGLRVCIPIGDRAEGGLYTFLRYWRRFLADRGAVVSEDLGGDYDVLFVNSFVVPCAEVLAAKRRLPGLRVMHRVDGSARDYGRTPEDDARQARVNMLADVTVYQSAYGRYATRRKFRVLCQDGPVIHNPVDTRMFCPAGERTALPGARRVGHVTFSTNPRKGAADLFAVARANPDLTFVAAGRYEDAPALPNLVTVGVVAHERLPALLRGCHALAFFAENETCSNVLAEGLACGLPVLFRDSGGNGELVGPCGAAVSPATFRSAFAELWPRRLEVAAAARTRAETLFAVNPVLERYGDALGRTVRRPLPTAARVAWLCLRGYPVWPGGRRRMLADAWRRLWRRPCGTRRAT